MSECNELEAARAERESIEAKYLASLQESRKADELAREKRLTREYAVLMELAATHGPEGKGIYVVQTDSGMVVLKKPNMLHYKRFSEAEKPDHESCQKLVRSCLVHPDTSSFNAILEEHPGVLVTCAQACTYLAGYRKQSFEGK